MLNIDTTYSHGSLGSRNDEERSEMRYVMRIAELRESSNLRTHTALTASVVSMLLSVSLPISYFFLFGESSSMEIGC